MLCELALVLLMDVSGSVDQREYQLQRDGTAAAFRSPAIGRLIEMSGAVAVTAIEWSVFPETTVPWRVLRTAADAQAFGADLEATQRTDGMGTRMGAALDGAARALDAVPCEAEREIVDVSGDGISDDGVAPARERLMARGVVVNALAVPDVAEPGLPEWFRAQVLTPGGFLVIADDFADFGRAIHRKLVLELAGR